MEREILFRGKRIDNGEWHYGSLIQNGSEFEIYDCNQDILHCGEEVIPETVGQFTGLHDQNGVRIFEGDYLFDLEIDSETQEDFSSRHPVLYDERKTMFCVDVSFRKNGSCLEPILGYFTHSQLKIHGSIHDEK